MNLFPCLLTLSLTAMLSLLPAHAAPEPLADKKIIPRQTPKPAPKSAPSLAFVRVINAVPNDSKIDAYNGSFKIASNLGFKSITNYVKVRSGKNKIRVHRAEKAAAPIVTDSFNFVKNKHYTLALMGKHAPVLLSVNESNGQEMPAKARIRVVHLMLGAPAVLTTVISTKNEAQYKKFLAQPLQYGKAASKTIRPATLQLQIRTEGGTLIQETANFALGANKRYSVFLVGEVNAKGANAPGFLMRTAIK